MNKLRSILLWLVVAAPCIGQSPQVPLAPPTPTTDLNAKYVQGVGLGYWPTVSSGLILKISPGTTLCNGLVTTYSGGLITLTAAVTNYVYINPSSSCTVAANTTGFTTSVIPLAKVGVGLSAITSIVDVRTLENYSWDSPPAIGDTVANSGTFTNLHAATSFTLAFLADGCLETVSSLVISTGSPCGSGSGSGNATEIQGNPIAATTPIQSAVPVWDGLIYNIRRLTQDDIAAGFGITAFGCVSCITVEIGASTTNPAFTASYSSIPLSASITNTASIDSPHTLSTPFTSGTVSGTFAKSTQSSVTFTLTAIGATTKTSTQTINWYPRSFGGVGAAGATNSVSASGVTAILSNGATLADAGLHSTNVGQVFGPYTPSGQKIYILCIGNSHTFKDGSGFTFAFNTPTLVNFVNSYSATVTMYLYESTNILFGPYSISVVN